VQKYILQAPDGAKIIGTEETISAVARIHNVAPNGSGGFDFDHTGDTDLDDNGQESVTVLGEIVYRDENGKNWMERELSIIPVAEARERPRCEQAIIWDG
jgi:hypothetical protein